MSNPSISVFWISANSPAPFPTDLRVNTSPLIFFLSGVTPLSAPYQKCFLFRLHWVQLCRKTSQLYYVIVVLIPDSVQGLQKRFYNRLMAPFCNKYSAYFFRLLSAYRSISVSWTGTSTPDASVIFMLKTVPGSNPNLNETGSSLSTTNCWTPLQAFLFCICFYHGSYII